MDEQKKRNVLIAVIVALVVIGGGIAFYFHQADSRYQAACEEAAAVLTDVQSLAKEADALPADPGSSEVKEYLDRLTKAQANLGTLADKLTDLRVGGKHEASVRALAEAINLEKEVLADAGGVLAAPDGKDADAQLKKVHDGLVKLGDRAANFDAELASAVQLDGLEDALTSYTKNVRDAAAKKQQAAAKAARLASFDNDPNLLFATKDDAGRRYYVIKSSINHMKGGTFSLSTKEVTADGNDRMLTWGFGFDEGQAWCTCKTDASLTPSDHYTKFSPVATAIIRTAWNFKYQTPAPYLD